MAERTYRVITRLDVSKLNEMFEKSMRSNAIAERVGTGTSFSHPNNKAFSDDPPTFATVASLGGQHQNHSGVELYLWDRGDHREVVVAPGKTPLMSTGGAAKKKAKQYVGDIEAVDPSATSSLI